jgi:hypothetical protein
MVKLARTPVSRSSLSFNRLKYSAHFWESLSSLGKLAVKEAEDGGWVGLLEEHIVTHTDDVVLEDADEFLAVVGEL